LKKKGRPKKSQNELTNKEKVKWANILLICQSIETYQKGKDMRGLDGTKLNLLDIILLGGKTPLSKVYEYLTK